MFANYEMLLEFPGRFESTDCCAKGTKTVAITPLTLYVCVCVSYGLGSSLSKHAFHIQEMVAPVSNKDVVSLLLIVTGMEYLHHILCYFI